MEEWVLPLILNVENDVFYHQWLFWEHTFPVMSSLSECRRIVLDDKPALPSRPHCPGRQSGACAG